MAKIKEYTIYNDCRFCGSKNVEKVINLGKIPLAGGFLKNKSEFKKEKRYPLELLFCNNCFLVQTSISINPDTLFRKYFYFSSKIQTLVKHFEKNAKKAKRLTGKKGFVVEIGCNDGVFIKALQRNNIRALGIDPAINVVIPLIKQGFPIINSYFSEKLAKKIVKRYKNADAIYSFHTLAHIKDMHDVVKGIKILLKPNGYLAFEVHYLGDLIEKLQYDMIYHEHLHYYSLYTLINLFNQYDMEIFDVERNDLRAGSIMYYVQNKDVGERRITKKAIDLIALEKKQKLDSPKTYKQFNKKIEKTKKDLLKMLNELKKKQKKIAGYGASGRGTVIINYCKLDNKFIDFVVDDAPAKNGYYIPGIHNRIYPSKQLIDKKIDYSILFAWPFAKEVKKRNKEYIKNSGKFIIPLPKVKII